MKSIIFMGTPLFAVPILEGLHKAGFQIKAVVTQPDRKTGRKQTLTQSPVKTKALELNLPVLQPEKLSGSVEMTKIIELAPDLIITAAYGQFLPTKILNAAAIGAINVHGSLLPNYRGGAPVQYALMNQDAQTGITVMHMAKKMDAGDIISQAPLEITSTDDVGTLFEKLSYLGRDLLLQTLPSIIDGSAPSIAQNEADVTFAYNITPEQEEIHISQSAVVIDALVRALRPHPGAYLETEAHRVKLWQVEPLEELTTQSAGVITQRTKRDFTVAVGNGTQLKILELQPAGKAKMSAISYLNGAGKDLAVGDVWVSQHG